MANSDLAERVHFVLVDTTHAGNIGAAARAMKTMGFGSLRVVQTNRQHQGKRSGEPHLGDEAYARASGAGDILENATVYDSLQAAIGDCVHAYGTSARSRSLEWQTVSARQAGQQVLSHYGGSEVQDHVAFVFGRERSGLTNDELALCSHRLNIPTNPDFSSLNLGSAVQVVAYELHVCLSSQTQGELPTRLQAQALAQAPSLSSEQSATRLTAGESDVTPGNGSKEEGTLEADRLADNAGMEQFFEHLERTLITIGFLKTDNPRLLMPRLRRYFGESRPRQSELNILRGILSAVNRHHQD